MKIEEKVAENDQKYRTLAENTSLSTVWVLDAKTLRFIYISPSVEELRGYSHSELIGESAEKLLSPESWVQTTEIIQKAIDDFPEKTDKSLSLEIEMYNKQGISVWLEVSAKLVKEDGDDLKIVGLSKTITERKIKEVERKDLINSLNEALAEKQRLVEEIKIFETLLPICSACRRIKDDKNTWWPLEKYIEEKAGSKVSHTICPDCTKIYYK